MPDTRKSITYNIATDDMIGDKNKSWIGWLRGKSNIELATERYHPNSLIVNVPEKILKASTGPEVQKIILADLEGRLKKFGTLNELVIAGHGSDGWEGFANTNHLRPFFLELARIQKRTGIKIADRIVLEGCETFGFDSVNPQEDQDANKDIEFYRNIAKTLNSQIVGSTTDVAINKFHGLMQGRFVQFTPSGDVIRDKLDTPDLYFKLKMTLYGIKDRLSWEECHLDKSQKDGASCFIRQQASIRSRTHE